MSDLISQFFADDDAANQFSLSEVIDKAKTIYGFDIRDQYCLYTGKPIGRVYDSELEFALSEEASDNLDDIVDSMVVRVVASMRPSPALNKPDSTTVRNLATRQPVDALCYFVNRLYGTRDLLVKRDGEHSFGPLLQRIQDYQRWSQLALDGLDLTPWIHWLAEIDAKMNLHDIRGPKVSLDRRNQLFTSFDGLPLFSFVTLDNAAQCYVVFEKWAFGQLGVYDREQSRLAMQGNWSRGNRHAITTFTQSWMENPVIARKSVIARDKHMNGLKAASAKVGRPKSEATAKKESKVNSALSLLDSILGSDSLSAKPASTPAPAPKPAPALKLNLGAMLNRVKKDGE